MNLLKSQSRRNESIDLIRGLSILSVILLHLSIFSAFTYQLPIPWLHNIVFNSGYYGVIVFFVVSGFLITQSIIRKWGSLSQIQVFYFYQNRFARIAPCLLGLLLILGLLNKMQVEPFVIQHTTLGKALFSALTFQINWLEAKTGYLPGSWDILWSLSIEEMFYLFFPLLCYFIRNRYLFVAVLCLCIIAGPWFRSIITDEIWQDKSYLSCMDGIAWGVLAAMCINQNYLSLQAKRGCFIVGFLLFSGVFFFRHLVFACGLTSTGLNVTLLECGIALILIGINPATVIKSSFRWLTFYGRNSYEIYLTHMPIMTALAGLLQYANYQKTSLFYAMTLLLCGLLGAFIARQYSKPLNYRLRQSYSSVSK